MNIYTYNFPTKIRFAAGVLSELGPELLSLGSKKPLVVTDRELATLPLFEKVKEAIESRGLPFILFKDLGGNPVKSQVEAGAAFYHENHCDIIVSIGGGAAIDVAKAIGVLVNHKGDLFDYEDIEGAKPIDKEVPLMIAIPTTAGTGSEVGRSAVVSDDKTRVKKIIFSPKLLPSIVLLDPVLTLGLPAHLTAATGIDAITHLVEAYLARGYNPLCDAIALHGLSLAAGSLERCVRAAREKEEATEEHLGARADMLHASMMGAIAFQKGLGANHSMAHALSTVFDFHHGLANAVVLPHVMKFKSEEVPEKFSDLEYAVNLERAGGSNFIPWLRELNAAVSIPSTQERLLEVILKPCSRLPCNACFKNRLFILLFSCRPPSTHIQR